MVVERPGFARRFLLMLLLLDHTTSLRVSLYLVRHCTSTFNAMSVPAGFTHDPNLSEQGREQADMVGRELTSRGLGAGTVVLTSEYRRARETGEAINDHIGGAEEKVVVTGLLNEVNFGFEGMMDESSSTLLNKVEYKNLVKKSFRTWSSPKSMHVSSSVPGTECGRSVLTRAQSAIIEMCEYASKTPSLSCVAVSHSSFLRVLLSVLQGEDLNSMYSVKQVNGCINVVEVENVGGEWFQVEGEGKGEDEGGDGVDDIAVVDEEIRKNEDVMKGLKIKGKVIKVNDSKHLSRGFGQGGGFGGGGKGFK